MDAPHLDGGRLPAPAEGPPAPISRRLVVFEGGVPVLKDVPLLTPTLMKDIQRAAMVERYAEPGDELAIELGLPPSEFYGRTLAEVMVIKQARRAAATGESELVEAIRDRLEGKPKTTAENVNHNINYESALLDIDAKEKARAAPPASPIIEAEVVPPAPADWKDLI